MLKDDADRSYAGEGEKLGFVRQFLKVFSVDAFAKAAGVLLLPLYLILMSQDEFATFNYVTAVIGVLSQVFTFGLYVPQSKIFHDITEGERGTLLLTINVILLILLSLTILPAYILGWDKTLVRFLFSGTVNYDRYRYLIPAGVILAVYSQMMLNYFLTCEQIGKVQRYNLSRLLLGSIVSIGALYWVAGNGASVRLSAHLGAELAAFIAFSIYYLHDMRGRFSTVVARRSLSMGLPIMGSAALGIAINFGDKFFIEKFCSLADMSVYFLGLTFSGVISAVFTAVQNVWIPRFLKEKNLALNLTRTRRIIRTLLLMFSILAVLIWLVVASAFHLDLINQDYIQVLVILPVLLIASICSSVVGLLSIYTVYWEMTYITVVSGVIIAIVSVPLNYYAAKAHGIHGIAVVSVFLHVLYAFIYYGFIRYRTIDLISRSKASWQQ